MAVVFGVRGDSLTARYSGGYPDPYVYNSRSGGIPVIAVDGTAIGGSVIDMDGGTREALQYPSRNNWTTTGDFSVLLRCKFDDTTSTQALWSWGRVNPQFPAPLFDVTMLSGDLRIYQFDDNGNLGVGGTTVANTFGTTAWHDIVVTYDNSTGVIELFEDASSLGTITTLQTYDAPGELDKVGLIGLGVCNYSTTSRIDTNEFVAWNEVIDPTSVTLTSGSGSLNGASRTAFVDVEASTGPAASGGGGGSGAGLGLPGIRV